MDCMQGTHPIMSAVAAMKRSGIAECLGYEPSILRRCIEPTLANASVKRWPERTEESYTLIAPTALGVFLMTVFLIAPFVLVCSGIALLAYFTASRQRGPFAFVLRKLNADRPSYIRVGRSLYAAAAALALFGFAASLWPTLVLPFTLWVGILLPLLGIVVQSFPVAAR